MKREPSVTKNYWPLTTKEQILEEAFKIPWTSQKMKEMTANYKSMESQDKSHCGWVFQIDSLLVPQALGCKLEEI